MASRDGWARAWLGGQECARVETKEQRGPPGQTSPQGSRAKGGRMLDSGTRGAGLRVYMNHTYLVWCPRNFNFCEAMILIHNN